ncbi:EamA family transporter [Uliginosibacterium sp. H3]|uniref:EamA family transporter n=1 Tax=Uliginosibacterium silvisoli TaxID=3114758 RepID=A0ABU6K0H9_9RHOO|nr:EamA family transporter [Uliginosibacterium sp. H3]
MKFLKAQPGVLAALCAALLFGAGTPLAKQLLGSINPWMLAGLLYLGSGLGLLAYRQLRRAAPVRLASGEWPWLAAAILSGGVVGPVLLMSGLSAMPAASVSLLLNAEGVLTALLAWFVFKENFDRRIVLGMLSIVAGSLVLSWPGTLSWSGMWPALAVIGACLAWGLDNNFTRKVSLNDATWIAAIKGLAAGVVNLLLAVRLGAALPPWSSALTAMAVGLGAYGISLTLFVVGLRHLGSARTGAYFSVAPFLGAALSMLMGEPLTMSLAIAGGLMAAGVVLHLTEHHEHLHAHEALAHAHPHVHDAHHQHAHAEEDMPQGDAPHVHHHRHEPMRHTHAHFPDAHHEHTHST